MSIENFTHDLYSRHNKRRQEHLASLRLPIQGRSVLEVGAGIGDHSSFFLDRGCRMTITDARPQNLALVRARYPQAAVERFDLEADDGPVPPVHDVVYCYGVLYHVARPAQALQRVAAATGEMLLLETCVSFGAEESVNVIEENPGDATQAANGKGCRPTRSWVYSELRRHFAFVYSTTTQPWHEEFPLDWQAAPPRNSTGLFRSVFVASRQAISSDRLVQGLPDVQGRD